MKRLLTLLIVIVFLCVAWPATAQTAGQVAPQVMPPAAAPAAPAKAAKVQDFAGITNFAPVDDMFACGGALKPDAVAELKSRGFKAVVNFRPDTEPGANVEQEQAAVTAAGLTYIHAPFTLTSAGPDIDKAVDTFLTAAKDPANRPMFFHCASGGRASAMWLFKRVLVDGWTTEKALPEAESVGLIQARVKTWALDYLKAKGK